MGDIKTLYQFTDDLPHHNVFTEKEYRLLMENGRTQDEIDRILDLVIETGIYSMGLNSRRFNESIRSRSLAWLGIDPFQVKKERE